MLHRSCCVVAIPGTFIRHAERVGHSLAFRTASQPLRGVYLPMCWPTQWKTSLPQNPRTCNTLNFHIYRAYDIVFLQALAEADARALRGEDGFVARVEAPSSNLIRLWIGVTPERMFEGMNSRAVEALGLDPEKGVEVMLKTDGHYVLSREPPSVQWARQVKPERMKQEPMSGGTCGGFVTERRKQ